MLILVNRWTEPADMCSGHPQPSITPRFPTDRKLVPETAKALATSNQLTAILHPPVLYCIMGQGGGMYMYYVYNEPTLLVMQGGRYVRREPRNVVPYQ